MKKQFLIAVLITTLAAPAGAFTVFDPSNFAQNLKSALKNILIEIHQVEALRRQALNLQKKGDFTGSGEDLQRQLSFYNRLTAEDQNLHTNLVRANNHNRVVRRSIRQSGLGRNTWLESEKRLQKLGRQRQVRRARQAKEIRDNINKGITDRQTLIQQNRDAAGAVEALQVNNELLSQVVDRLDVLTYQQAEQVEELGRDQEQLQKTRDAAVERQRQTLETLETLAKERKERLETWKDLKIP